MSNISKQSIDVAGQLRTVGMTWQDLNELMFQQGHVDSKGKKIHNQALCIKVLEDPQWAHLRENKLFSVSKLNIIANAMRNAGISEDKISTVITVIGS